MKKRSRLLKTINSLLGTFGLGLVRSVPSEGNIKGYISAKETVAAAKMNNLSVCDYLERIWNKQGDTQRVIENMNKFGVFSKAIKNICEIGPGSGRYLEKVMRICNPLRYDIYETAQDWADWLAQEYNIVPRNADGRTLCHTESSSVDLVHAHGVFVYVPFLTSYQYFQEIVRVTNNNAFAVFDIISEDCLDDDTVMKWLQSGDDYPCFLSNSYVKSFFISRGFSFVGDFFNRYGPGKSQYLIFQKHLC
jgi:hypothetical protein